MILEILLLLLSVFSASTAVIMIKASETPPVLLAGLRLLVATLVLLPLYIRDYRRYRESYTRAQLAASVVPGLVLAAHLGSWAFGARLTPTANASLIVNLVPLAMPFFLVWLAREPLKRREVLATGLALVGVAILTLADLNLSSQYFVGDLICFGSMLCYALYMALGRRNRHHPTVWLYLVPLYAVAAGASLALAAVASVPQQVAAPVRELLLVLGIGHEPTVLGHSLLNRAMKHFRGQIVSIVNMAQFVFSGLMAFLLWGEVPSGSSLVAAAVVGAAAYIAVSGRVATEAGGE